MMGGSGGRWSSEDVTSLKKELQRSIENTREADFDANVNARLNDLLVYFNDRDTEGVKRRLDKIGKALKIELGPVDLRFGGSVHKHTYVDGLSDIDSLVLIDDPAWKRTPPNTLRSNFLARLKKDLPEADAVECGTMAVTVTYKDGTAIQLLPAVKTDEGVKIPIADGKSWSEINPDGFTRKLTKVNTKQEGKVVPAIKLIKAINSQFPPKQQMTGYHIEAVALEAFASYNGPRDAKSMLEFFFKKAPVLVKSPIADKTNQSIHVDDYLGGSNSPRRQGIAYHLETVAKKLEQAGRRSSTSLWIDVFGDLQ